MKTMKHPLYDLSEMFLKSKPYQASTIKRYRIAYKHYIKYLVKHDILYAHVKDVKNFMHELHNKGYAVNWINIQISALKGLYLYLSRHQKILKLPKVYSYNIMTVIKRRRQTYRIKGAVLTIKEAKKLLISTKARTDYIWHLRDHAIISLMLTRALRVREILSLKIKDFKIEGNLAYLDIKNQSSGQSDTIKLSRQTQDAIISYLEKRNGRDQNPYLFISHKKKSKTGRLSDSFFMYMLPRVLKLSGLTHKKITPHSLRHTAGLIHLNMSGNMLLTQKLLRHQDIQSTFVYADYLKKLKDDTEQQLEAYYLKETSYFKYEDWFDF